MLVFIASTTGLRVYIAVLTSSGYTYGALATPIAFLLFGFMLGLSIVLGAHFNHALEVVWPSRSAPGGRRSEKLRAAAKWGTERVTGRSAASPELPAGGPATHPAEARSTSEATPTAAKEPG
jgi:membrane protein